jgi:hypothetical protein
MVNVTQEKVHITVALSELDTQENNWYDLLSNKGFLAIEEKLTFVLEPYAVLWLKASND